jgi:hypothetical protein
MLNADNDAISAYIPQDVNPETWNVSADTSEWGAKLMSTSTVYDSDKWGADDTYTGGKWFNVDDTAPFSVITTTESTSLAGDDENIRFGAEIGANKMQPTGPYRVNVTITVPAL